MNHEKETRKVPVPTDEEALAFAEAISQAGSAIQALRQIQAGLHERRYEEYDWIALLARCEGETKDFACPPVTTLPQPSGSYGQALADFADYQDYSEALQARADEARLEAEGQWEREQAEQQRWEAAANGVDWEGPVTEAEAREQAQRHAGTRAGELWQAAADLIRQTGQGQA